MEAADRSAVETEGVPDRDGRAGDRRAPSVERPVTVFDARPELRDWRRFIRRGHKSLAFSARLAPMLFAMQLRSRRRANLLGLLWLLLPILVTIAIGLILQSRRPFPLPETSVPYAAFLVTGIALWQTLAEALNLPLQQLSANRHALTRQHMPIEAPVLAGLIELALNAAIRFVLVLAALPFLGAEPGASLLAFPIALAGLVALGIAIGIAVAPAGLLVEDVGRALLLFAGLWMVASPVLYPTSGYPVLSLNPAAPLIEAARASLTGQAPPASAWPVAAACIAALLPAWLWLRLSRHHFLDRLA